MLAVWRTGRHDERADARILHTGIPYFETLEAELAAAVLLRHVFEKVPKIKYSCFGAFLFRVMMVAMGGERP